jgi:hypothetical protein
MASSSFFVQGLNIFDAFMNVDLHPILRPTSDALVDHASRVVVWNGFGSGVDVMIAIFCDFCQLSEKKLAFFSKTNATITFLIKKN